MNADTGLLVDNASPVLTRRLPDWVEPADAFQQIAHLPGAVLLESQPGALGGRFSVICARPFGTLHTNGHDSLLSLPDGVIRTEASPFDVLGLVLSRFSMPCSSGLTFAGGAVGYLGYELGSFIETIPAPRPDDVGMPDCWMGFYNCAAVFDHARRAVILNACLLDEAPDPEQGLAALSQLILSARGESASHCPANVRAGLPASSFTKVEYIEAVKRVKEYIAAGDIYQANTSQRFSAPLGMTPWEMYLRLRERNPAPYAAFLNLGESQVVSSSPECFLTYDPMSRLVETKPIKGTRPRGSTPEEDERLARELAASEKDIAENVMIVDLERNDLGRVCEFGSVQVPELFAVESHPTVHHLVSTVTGRLRPEYGSVDLLTACFPGGSITGAPKIRAMEIIHEIEPVRRGVYTGSIGWTGFDGSVNLNIVIRTAVVKDGICHIHVGGGIVADSDPEMEYQETLDKARAFLEVLGCM